MSKTERAFWAGVAEVVPKTGNALLEGADGAYVSVVGLASSTSAFLKNVRFAFDAMDFDVVGVADIEFVSSPGCWTGDLVMRERAAALGPDNPIECGPFHCYRGSD